MSNTLLCNISKRSEDLLGLSHEAVSDVSDLLRGIVLALKMTYPELQFTSSAVGMAVSHRNCCHVLISPA